jgi:hypothetical protein
MGETMLFLELRGGGVDLNVVARHLLGTAESVYRPPTHPVRRPVQPIAAKYPIYARVGDLDPVVALEIPDDANRPRVIGRAEMKGLLHDLR